GRPCLGHVWNSTLNVTWEASNVIWCFMDGHGCHVWSLAFTKLKRDMGDMGDMGEGLGSFHQLLVTMHNTQEG
ncbi:hypothetical protein PIB30_110922, partial [Stylosanthes scabra]|nr:hypothetical protein [Stylosanthes scabra]